MFKWRHARTGEIRKSSIRPSGMDWVKSGVSESYTSRSYDSGPSTMDTFASVIAAETLISAFDSSPSYTSSDSSPSFSGDGGSFGGGGSSGDY